MYACNGSIKQIQGQQIGKRAEVAKQKASNAGRRDKTVYFVAGHVGANVSSPIICIKGTLKKEGDMQII